MYITSLFSWQSSSTAETRRLWLHSRLLCQCKHHIVHACCYMYTGLHHTVSCTGLQTQESIHHSTEPNGEHCQRLLENDSGERVYSCRHAVWIWGRWTGKYVYLSYSVTLWVFTHTELSIRNIRWLTQSVCHQYWSSTGSVSYADLCVELVSEEQLGGYVERTLSVTIGKVCNAYSVLICGGFIQTTSRLVCYSCYCSLASLIR